MDMRVGEAALGSPDTGYNLLPIRPRDLAIDLPSRKIKSGSYTFGWDHTNQLVAAKDGVILFGTPVLYLNGLPASCVDMHAFLSIVQGSPG